MWGQDTPREFRNGNNAAPNVYVGFEGAPGHQAGPLNGGARGGYGSHPTYGGYDQMTARVGGLWDSLLGEGRRWWITATSDSHVHWTRGGSDFWPGEYSKTYVLARQDYADIMDGLRNGRIWVTTGDLITSLDLTAGGQGKEAAVGETITVSRRQRTDVEIEIRFRPLDGVNHNGDRPEVRRVDLIVGEITGPSADLDADTNPTTRVVGRFGPGTGASRASTTSSSTHCAMCRPICTPASEAPAPTRPSRSPTARSPRGRTCGSTRTRSSSTSGRAWRQLGPIRDRLCGPIRV
ncbi:hypothetical protein ACFQ2Y_43470 [Streptomyces malaysiensis subsp. malaysiensis]